jgi:hypothetical protein
LKLNGTYRLLVNADGVNIYSGSVHTIQKRAEALLVSSMEVGLELNAYKTKYSIFSNLIRTLFIVLEG